MDICVLLTGDDDGVRDEVVVLRGVAQLVLHAPPTVTRPHNLHYPSINLFKLATQHHNLNVSSPYHESHECLSQV